MQSSKDFDEDTQKDGRPAPTFHVRMSAAVGVDVRVKSKVCDCADCVHGECADFTCSI